MDLQPCVNLCSIGDAVEIVDWYKFYLISDIDYEESNNYKKVCFWI